MHHQTNLTIITPKRKAVPLTAIMITDLLLTHFPTLTSAQLANFERLPALYETWNEKINVVSRKDMQHFAERHILHSLSIGKFLHFLPGTEVLDIGTGGGFPGIPLAIMFPEVQFTLVDSIGKKIMVVKEIAAEMKMDNVAAHHARAENIPGPFDFVVSRAVTQMPVFLPWIKGKLKPKSVHSIENGLLYLKGGDLREEMQGIPHEEVELRTYFDGEFFETKKIIYVPRTVVEKTKTLKAK